MSKVKIEGHGTGTGTFTVTTPSSNTDRTITLPDGTGTLIADDGSGNLGIGVSNPAEKLDVAGDLLIGNGRSNSTEKHATVSAVGYNTGVNPMCIAYANGHSGGNYIRFGGGVSNVSPATSFQFFTATGTPANGEGTKRVTIDSDGLKFNTDTAAANALDDYEEGTFTATLTSGTPPSSPPTATGNYTKIGNRVHFEIFRFSNVNTSGGSGEMKITGLPFTLGTSAISGNIAMRGLSFDTSKMLFAELHSGTTTMNFVEATSGGAWGNLNITAGTGKYLAISGSYKI